MPIELRVVTTKEEVEAGAALEWEVHNNRKPVDTAWELFKGRSQAEYKARRSKDLDLASDMVVVHATDAESGELVGAAHYSNYESNPFDILITLLRQHPEVIESVKRKWLAVRLSIGMWVVR